MGLSKGRMGGTMRSEKLKNRMHSVAFGLEVFDILVDLFKVYFYKKL